MPDHDQKKYFQDFLKFLGIIFAMYLALNLESFVEIRNELKLSILLILALTLVAMYAAQEFFKDFIGNELEFSTRDFRLHPFNDRDQKQYAFKPVTDSNLEIIAVHEIGHVMLFYAFGDAPEQLYVQIHDQDIDTPNRGYVYFSFGERENRGLTLSDINVFMLIYLSGMQAEKFYFNDQRLFGSTQDMDKWLHYAKLYLIHEENTIFYNSPQNQFEQNHNAKLLSDLKQKQVQILSEFFNTNRIVLNELVDKLKKNKRLGYVDLKAYMKLIVNTAEISNQAI